MNTMVTNGQKGSDVQLGRRQELRCCSIPLDKNVLTVCKSHNSTFIEMTIKKLKKQRASCRLFGLFWVSGPKTDFVPLLLLLVVYRIDRSVGRKLVGKINGTTRRTSFLVYTSEH